MKASTYLETLTRIISQIEVTTNNSETLMMDNGAQQVVDLIKKIKATGKKVMVVGNGGSAAIASHIHNDLSKSVGVRALVFNETPLLTAFSNDLSYTVAFKQHVTLWADREDMLIAISSSGKSENILLAAKSASALGCTVVTLSGFKKDNPLRQIGHVNFYVPSDEYGYVELAHSILSHYISDEASKRCKK